jgi:uncharacterized protein (DUF952 family)
MTEPILHLADRAAWESARATGTPYAMSTRDLTLEEEGFIHCATETQLPGVLDRYYRGLEHTLVLLEIDPARLGAEVRYEPSGGDLFPHIYGPIPIDAVLKVRPAPRTR